MTNWNPTDQELTAIYKKANGEDAGKKPQPLLTSRIYRAMRAMLAAAPTEPSKPEQAGAPPDLTPLMGELSIAERTVRCDFADFVQCQPCELLDPDATCPQCPGWLKTLDDQQIEDCFQEAAGADEETHLRFAHAVINKFCEFNRLPPFATTPPASAAGEREARRWRMLAYMEARGIAPSTIVHYIARPDRLDYTAEIHEQHGDLSAALASKPQDEQKPVEEYNGWYCAHCRRGVDGSEVTFREQHTECGRVITNDRPPASLPEQVARDSFTLDELADACMAAEIPDSKYETLCIELDRAARTRGEGGV